MTTANELVANYTNIINNTSADLVLTYSVIYYVNNTTGSNSNDGLTEATAFATCAKAISMLPMFSNSKSALIYLDDNANDSIIITNKYGYSSINIFCNALGSASAYALRIGNIDAVSVNIINLSSTDDFMYIKTIRSFYIEGGTYAGINIDDSGGTITSCISVNGTTNYGIKLNRSNVYINDVTGNSSQYGIEAYDSVIRIAGAQPTGDEKDQYLENTTIT